MDKLNWSDWEEQFHRWKIESIYIADANHILDSWQYNGQDRITPIFSATKSVLSLLIGIALDKQLFPKLDTPLQTVLHEQQLSLLAIDERITIEHLLTMTAGWQWPWFDQPYFKLGSSSDMIRDILAASQENEPGTAFCYNSGCSYLLGAILSKYTKMSLLQFATTHLFMPLQIEPVTWNQLGQYEEGGTGLAMKGADFVKLGQLCLRGGKLGEEQIVPAAWLQAATKQQHEALLHESPRVHGAFGYHWWSTPATINQIADCYFAYGFSGQMLIVFPTLHLTIAIKRRPTNRKDGLRTKHIVFDLVLPALLNHKQ